MRLDDRLWLLFSKGKRIDGVWVGALVGGYKLPVGRVEEALRLIRTYDPLNYSRVIRELDRILITFLISSIGNYNVRINACQLDERFVLAETTQPEDIASAIVHEATHARLMRRGIPYDEAIRERVEKVCVRRERAFGAKLPNGERVMADAEKCLVGYPAGFFSDASFKEREDEGGIRALRELGTPEWFIASMFWLRDLLERFRRLKRRLGFRRSPF